MGMRMRMGFEWEWGKEYCSTVDQGKRESNYCTVLYSSCTSTVCLLMRIMGPD